MKCPENFEVYFESIKSFCLLFFLFSPAGFSPEGECRVVAAQECRG
jgi:hypothetical protein